MKNKLFIITILFATLFSACTDWLDIKPLDSMTEDDYWKTESDVESVVLTCYKSLLAKDLIERIIISGELRSDNVVEGASMERELKYINDAGILSSNKFTTWGTFYTVINNCNTVIANAEKVMQEDPDYTQGLLNGHMAEVLTLRALAYFYLVRIYGDVPFITTPSSDDSQDFKEPQTPADEILNYLIEDLVKAERYAVLVRGNKNQYDFDVLNKGRITKNAVRALLADIYLWQFKYQECIDVCNKVLEHFYTQEEYREIDYNLRTGAEYVLIENTNSGFGAFTNLFYFGNSTESIFEAQYDLNNKNEIIQGYYSKATTVGTFAASDLGSSDWNIFSASDVRGKDSFIDLQQSAGYNKIFKYKGESRTAHSDGSSTYLYTSDTYNPNWIYYRISDILLMKAEALAELNSLQEALDMVNITYMRSNPTVSRPLQLTNYPTQDDMRELVLLERHREFLFEGKRWFDLLRLARREGSTQTVLGKYLLRKYTYNGDIIANKLSTINAMYLPINETEMNVNPNLVQNEYYKK